MGKRLARIRSGPLYVQADGEVISLVAEAEVSPASYDISQKSNSAKAMRPVAVYVIDKKGVRRMAVRSGRSSSLPAQLLGILIMPLQYALLKWWKKSRA